MLVDNKRDYEFSMEGNEGQMVRIHVSYYAPSTNSSIPDEIKFEAHSESEQGAVGELLYDEEEYYDVEEVLEEIREKEQWRRNNGRS